MSERIDKPPEQEFLRLRPAQERILAYRAGRMGVSAVPGSGKTWTLSLLAADLIMRGVLEDDQEILIVTLVNAAVDNFYQRVSSFVNVWGLLPHYGYRVRTLHGLAHDIVRERPDLLGLDTHFQIIDEREAASIRATVARTWLQAHFYDLDSYLEPTLDDSRLDWVHREQLPKLIEEIALSMIRRAKDLRYSPEDLRTRLEILPVPLPLAEMGRELYENYQRALAYRGAVDFDDLIRLALQALEWDPSLLEYLQHRWPYILEDEAQDSSALQEQILALLAGPQGNWVRVGDPNQAIYETFTTADPRYLRDFTLSPGVARHELPNSGRSTRSIIHLANALVRWTQLEHPNPSVRDALQSPPEIEPTPPDDPQPNPDNALTRIHLILRKFTPAEELTAVADSLERWLPENPQATVAVLAPLNHHVENLADELRRRHIPYFDGMLRSTNATRFSAGTLAHILRCLADPQSPKKLAKAYEVWRRGDRDDPEAGQQLNLVMELLRKVPRTEDYLWPNPGFDWLDSANLEVEDPLAYERLSEFRGLVRRWQGAIFLPIDQLTLTLAQDLLSEPSELALAHKLALLLRRAGNDHPSWQLPDLTNELAVIARNERRFLGFSQDDTGFNPDQHCGQVVVSTMHKAKGLEWDRVYLLSINNYDFPSGTAGEDYRAEKWYLRDGLNLEAEALEQLEVIQKADEYQWYEEGRATQQARLDYIRERLRLLYVGITRARKELVITWNSGTKGNCQPAIPLVAMHGLASQAGSIDSDAPSEEEA
ncbi:MAG: ATP-dependent helicase [Anaerolineales bacterium]|nr:ATP-dependent helicase [Anaerolineales bacterium]